MTFFRQFLRYIIRVDNYRSTAYNIKVCLIQSTLPNFEFYKHTTLFVFLVCAEYIFGIFHLGVNKHKFKEMFTVCDLQKHSKEKSITFFPSVFLSCLVCECRRWHCSTQLFTFQCFECPHVVYTRTYRYQFLPPLSLFLFLSLSLFICISSVFHRISFLD